MGVEPRGEVSGQQYISHIRHIPEANADHHMTFGPNPGSDFRSLCPFHVSSREAFPSVVDRLSV